MEYTDEMKPKVRTFKITMPYEYANEFLAESKISFYDSRWLNVAFKDKMYQALIKIQPDDVKKEIEDIKEQMIQMIKEMYSRNGGFKNVE